MLGHRVKSQDENVSAKFVVTISFIVDFFDIVLSLAVAILTGSVVMLSQFFEGVSDLIASGLLLVGLARSRQKEDKNHPYGFGRELYLWALLSGIVMLTLTAGLSTYYGWQRFINPHPIEDINLAFGILILTTFTNGYALYLSVKRLLKNHNLKNIISVFFRSSLIETKTTFVLDLMGVSASIIGIIALIIYQITGDFRYDGLGAVLVGCVMAIFAYILLIGAVDLIIGKSASPEVERKIKSTALNVPQVDKILNLKTLHIGSEKLLVNLEVHLKHGLTTREIERLIDTIKENIKREVPEVSHIQIELESLSRK